MLKHFLVGTLTVSSLAMAAYPPAPVHGAVPVAPPPPPRTMPVAAPPPPVNAIRVDDTRRASELLRAFDAATARRDVRAINTIERQFRGFLDEEQREARMARNGRTLMTRLNRIESELNRLQGKMNARSLSAKRALYVELVQLADGRVAGRRF